MSASSYAILFPAYVFISWLLYGVPRHTPALTSEGGGQLHQGGAWAGTYRSALTLVCATARQATQFQGRSDAATVAVISVQRQTFSQRSQVHEYMVRQYVFFEQAVAAGHQVAFHGPTRFTRRAAIPAQLGREPTATCMLPSAS